MGAESMERDLQAKSAELKEAQDKIQTHRGEIEELQQSARDMEESLLNELEHLDTVLGAKEEEISALAEKNRQLLSMRNIDNIHKVNRAFGEFLDENAQYSREYRIYTVKG